MSGVTLAQYGSISGTVSGSGVRVPATITVLNVPDSSWVRSEVANDKGEFLTRGMRPGEYLVTASSVGYTNGWQKVTVADTGRHQLSIELLKTTQSLEEVAVSAKKPFIEMSMGKMTVNIEGTTTAAGSNVLDLLRRSPGVTVDQGGQISMRGKEGALVLIDDRSTYLAGDDLAEYLRSIVADEVAKIELMTQPGAKYDASGNTGIINVKLKKNRKQGWNGNINLSYGLGVYFHRNESFLLHYRKNKLNLSLTANDMEAIGFADWREHRYFLDKQTGNVTSSSTIHSTPKERFSNTAPKLAADYNATEKTTMGVSIRGNYHPNITHGFIAASNTDPAASNTYNNITSTDGHIRKDITANTYLSHQFGKGRALDINIDYLSFEKKAYQDVTNVTYDEQMHALPDPIVTNTQQKTNINVYSIKADYTHEFSNGVKTECGLKSSLVTTDNNVTGRRYSNSNWTNDTGNTNRFEYGENINAVYTTVDKALGQKWMMRAGLRAEQTNANGWQYVHNVEFFRNYLSLFPTAYIAYKKDSDNQFEVNYGRRVDRPSYKLLNPFVYYSFQYNYLKGNPYLEPQYTHNIELKHSYKNRIISTINASTINHVFSDVLEANDSSKVVYNINRNIGLNNVVSFAVVYDRDIFEWWSLNGGGSVFYAEYETTIDHIKSNIQWSGYSVNLSTQFSIGKGWKAEAYGYYNSKGRFSLTSGFGGNGYFEAGASKKINERLLVKFFAYDPFYFQKTRLYSETDNFRNDVHFREASQLFYLSVTYSFGQNQQGERNGKSIDEAKRL